jgi:hypothetical protein
MADKVEDQELDPIVRAAMIPDPDDEPSEGKESQKTESEEAKKSDKTEADNAATKTEKTATTENDDKKTEDEKGKEDPNKEVPKPKTEDGKSSDEQRQSRKERREERKQRFIEKIQREAKSTKTEPEKAEKTDYKPLDYKEGQYDAKELQEDRDKYSEVKANEVRESERKLAEQDKFWTTLEYEAKILSFDPKYAFLDENSQDFDEDRAATINEMYLELVGFNPKTKTVQRTDLSYEKFAKTFIDQMEEWAEERQAETVKNLAAQSANAGIRPSGSASQGLKKLKPGDISRMSQEEFEKNEAEIDRQILAELAS